MEARLRLSRFLKAAVNSTGQTQKEIASAIAVPASTLSRWMTGAVIFPHRSILAFSQVTNCDLSELKQLIDAAKAESVAITAEVLLARIQRLEARVQQLETRMSMYAIQLAEHLNTHATSSDV